MGYTSDRQFTDMVHNQLAVDIIYKQMKWKDQRLNGRMLENIDMQNAVDYIAIDCSNPEDPRVITIQERFREEKYQNFHDFTMRYKRPQNSHKERINSEFFKIDADYFIYGCINTNKGNVKNATGFVKYAVIDIPRLKNLINSGIVAICPDLGGFKCRWTKGQMLCPVIENVDKSSTFVPFDIGILGRVDPKCIVYQENFY